MLEKTLAVSRVVGTLELGGKDDIVGCGAGSPPSFCTSTVNGTWDVSALDSP